MYALNIKKINRLIQKDRKFLKLTENIMLLVNLTMLIYSQAKKDKKKSKQKSSIKNKVSVPFQYPDSFILFLLRLKVIFQVDYRTLPDIENGLIKFIPHAKKSANYLSTTKGKIAMQEKRKRDIEIEKRLIRLEEMERYQRDEDRWREECGYGYRWRCEGRYSAFKRIFGEEVFSKEMENVRNEVQIKVNLLNQFTSILIKANKSNRIEAG